MTRRLWIGVSFVLTSLLIAGPSFAYDGYVTAEEAYQMATESANVFILDVRTPEEWVWVGHPGQNASGEGDALEGKVVNISWWLGYPGTFRDNGSFLSDVAESFEDIPNVVLITMCRAGGRADMAASVLYAAGYTVYNMEYGFEGRKDMDGYRTLNGWVVDGLPYNDSWGGAYPD